MRIQTETFVKGLKEILGEKFKPELYNSVMKYVDDEINKIITSVEVNHVYSNITQNTDHYVLRKHNLGQNINFDIEQKNLMYSDCSPTHHGLQCNHIGGTEQYDMILEQCQLLIQTIKAIDILNNGKAYKSSQKETINTLNNASMKVLEKYIQKEDNELFEEDGICECGFKTNIELRPNGKRYCGHCHKLYE